MFHEFCLRVLRKRELGKGFILLVFWSMFCKKMQSLLPDSIGLSDAKKSFKRGIEEGILLSCMHLINIASDDEMEITCRVSSGALDTACCVSK